jgi:nucleoside-diphosphate-sugar epimerase
LISIIGGSGFIGTRLCRRLHGAKKEFVVFDKARSKAFPSVCSVGDVRDSCALRDWMPESSIVINLAAEHRDDVTPVSLYDDVNVQGARNICSAAREKNVRTIIFTSSVAVYGFAPIGTNEAGAIRPFNNYGRTKAEAEAVLAAWQAEDAANRTLVIVRPTVVFGERNRGNVYNLLKQLASNSFIMIGRGENRKSIAYVENVAAFIEHCTHLSPGTHVYNYVDKPDFTMNELVIHIRRLLGRSSRIGLRLPYGVGFVVGKMFDIASKITGRRFAVSAIRVRKFCADSVYATAVSKTGFVPPVRLDDALARTVRREFIEPDESEELFYTE